MRKILFFTLLVLLVATKGYTISSIVEKTLMPAVDPLQIDSFQLSSSSICLGDTADILPVVSGGTEIYQYSWTSNPAGFTSQQASISVIPGITTWYILTLTDGNETLIDSVKVQVRIVPAIDQVSNIVVCNNAMVPTINFTGSGALFTTFWTNSNPAIGLTATGSGDIQSFVAHNNGTNMITANISVRPIVSGCTGSPITFSISVKPSPTTNPVSNKTYCDKALTNVINFSGPMPGTTFTWFNNNTTIGLGNGGSGSIQPFVAINNTSNPVMATITVTPMANGCNGVPTTFTIKVNPTPILDPVYNQSFCNNVATNPVIFTSNIAGSTATWTNSNPDIGLPASGNGNLPSFVPVNLTNSVISSTLSISPVANNCQGSPYNVQINVYPSSTMVQSPDLMVCPGNAVFVDGFTGNQSGTTFTWTNNNVSTGLSSSGTGNIPVFTALNPNEDPLVAEITVVPHTNNCPGVPMVFQITVNSNPVVSLPSYQTIQAGDSVNLMASVTGANAPFSFSWSNGMTGQSVMVSPEVTTVFEVTVTDILGCSAVGQTSVLVVEGNPVVVSIPDVVDCPGLLTVPVWTNDLTQISSISLTLQYDTSTLAYMGYQNPNPLLTGFFQVNSNAQNILIAWFSMTPVTISGGVLIELLFVSEPGSTVISWDQNTIGACQFTDLWGTPLPAMFLNGSTQTEVCTGLHGFVSYDNNNETSLNGLTVKLLQGNDVVFQCITNELGYYQFDDLIEGTYTLAVETSLPWGGVNAVDALMILQHFVGTLTLSPLRTLAADVNANGNINATDALLVTKRFVGMVNSFPPGDWLFAPQTVVIEQGGALPLNIKGICYGDVDGSYVPGN